MPQRRTQFVAALLLAALLLGGFVLGSEARVAATPGLSPGCRTGVNGQVICHVTTGPAPGSGIDPIVTGVGGSTGSAAGRTVVGARLGTNPRTGAECYVTIVVNTAGLTPAQIKQIEFDAGALEGVLPACPGQPKGVAVPTVTPAQLAQEYWYRIRLPVPRPDSSPDYATTGKMTYLQAGDTDDPPTWTQGTVLGMLAITAHGSYTVSWGDGTAETGPYATPGGPYPAGTITHTYDTTGTVTITVQERWSATWTLGAAHGVLADLRTTGDLPDFAVRQLQAVVTG